MALQYNIDTFTIVGDAWRVWGWAVTDDGRAVADIVLQMNFASGEVSSNLMTGSYRPDVGALFAGLPLANQAGFMGFGQAPRERLIEATLHVTYSDGSTELVDVSRFVQSGPSTRRWVLSKARVAARLLRGGQFRVLFHKLITTARGKFGMPGRKLANDRWPSIFEPRVVLIVDHAMGGGANVFSAQLKAQFLSEGRAVGVLSYQLSSMQYSLDVQRPEARGAISRSAASIEEVSAWLRRSKFSEMHINNTVSFPSNKSIIDELLKSQPKAAVHYYVHDYYSVCPSFNLLDSDGRYCGVPDASVCRLKCLPNSRDLFVLSQAQADVEEWRSIWRSVFDRAISIRFFSEASREIVLRAFGAIDEAKIITSPHVVPEKLQPTLAATRRGTGVRIGVVGTLNHAKGSDVVAELCNYLHCENIDAEVVVIGTIDRPIEVPFLTIVGPYQRKSLPRIMDRYGINVALFPSVWPETFSFVVEELSQLSVPIVAFDLGAPAERLKGRPAVELLPVSASVEELASALQRAASSSVVAAPSVARPVSRTCAFTSAATNYLPKAMLLASSIKRFHPEMDVFYGLSDELDRATDYERGVFDGVIPADVLSIPSFTSWTFGHDIVEFSTAIKPFIVKELLSRGYETVYYFDPDIVVYSRLNDLFESTEAGSISLTPHQTEREVDYQAIIDNEMASLRYGVYNLGYIGVRNTDEGRKFAQWWADRLYEWCRDDIPSGLFTDQRWIDLAPALFEGVKVVRDSRFNVSTWNVTRRQVSRDTDGEYFVDGKKLGFYHFTGFDKGAHRVMAEKNSRNNPAVMSLVDWYQTATMFAPDDAASSVKWAYGSYSDGVSIPLAHRRIYRDRRDLRVAFPDPFDGGNGACCRMPFISFDPRLTG